MNQSVGRYGEDLATNYLQLHGFQILHRNYRTKAGEIDIVAEKNEVVYFVEVKTRSSDKHGKPYEAVNYRKQSHMKRCAEWYVLQNNFRKSKLKLAVISILIDGKTETINVYELD